MFSPTPSTLSTPQNTPGSVALETVKHIADPSAIFKKPHGVAKRSRAQILDEDTYIQRMGEIIQRDFFPDLAKLVAQTEYIEALENNDRKRMRELYEKYSLERPRNSVRRLASPAGFETPVLGELEPDTPGDDLASSSGTLGEDREAKKERDKVGLDEFLSYNTSEDNASFEEILRENEKKHRLKYAWLYKTETSRPAIQGPSRLAIEGSGGDKSPVIDTWSYRNKNYIMYIPDGVDLTVEEKIELAKKRQQVVHNNTRLKGNPFDERQNKATISHLAKQQSKTHDGKIGVDGKEIIREETPRVRGYAIVASPAAAAASPAISEGLDSPLMTWGQIEGTPFRLDGGDTPRISANCGPSFRMAEMPKRERLAMQLAEKANERNRDKKNKALDAARRSLRTPSPRSSIDRLNTMSPAARRLATQKLRIPVTPSPSRTRVKTPSLGIKTPNVPRLESPLTKTYNNSTKLQSPILTDNLLKLPQRQRAADFFNN